tara:strand:- start:106 stop:807 length:702 start_codon:yes stop_codon:yes gene_type:complete
MGKPNFSEDFKRDAVHQMTVRGYAVREVSERLGVSTYSLYKWMKLYAKAASQTSSVDHEAESRRLKRELARVAGIRAEIGYKRKPGKYGGRPSVVVDNTLDRQFDVTAPDTAWVSDITYIKTYEGFLYLAVIIDLYSRRVIGWATQSRQPTDLVLQALLMAVWRRKPKRRVLIHTDQGLTNIGASMRASIVLGPMADKDLPESFFNLLKRERVRETQAAPGHHLNSPLKNSPP